MNGPKEHGNKVLGSIKVGYCKHGNNAFGSIEVLTS